MEHSSDTNADSQSGPFREAWLPQRRPRSRLQQALTALAGQQPEPNGTVAVSTPERHELPWDAPTSHARPPDEPIATATEDEAVEVMTADVVEDAIDIEEGSPQPRPTGPAPGPLPADGEEPLHVIVDVTPRARDELATLDTT
ncbi:MAG: hypothetical protein KJO18_07780, partial [Acidimicrobiia bacterium]|nr:hypothetical protein [Acidimicrobiia bacterium]